VTSSLSASRLSWSPIAGRDLRSITTGGDKQVVGGQDGFRDVDTQPTAGAGNEPHLWVPHIIVLIMATTEIPHTTLQI
jgi:hypothetical protein